MGITRGSYGRLKGSAYKLPCRLATTASVTLSSPPSSVDGITTTVGDRILVWKQTNQDENGIYVVDTSVWTRALDFSIDDDVIKGLQVYVNEGTTYSKKIFALETTGIIGAALLVFNPIGAQGPQGNKGGLLYGYQVGGTGSFSFSNPDASLTTQITFNPKTLEGTSIDSFITSWSEAGTITIQGNTNGDSTYAIFEVGMVITDNVFPTGVVYKVDVTYIGGTTPTALETCVVNFSRTGAKGDSCVNYKIEFPLIVPTPPATIDYIDCNYNVITGLSLVPNEILYINAISGTVLTNFVTEVYITPLGLVTGKDGANSLRWKYVGVGVAPDAYEFNTTTSDSLGFLTAMKFDLYDLSTEYALNWFDAIQSGRTVLQIRDTANNTIVGTYNITSDSYNAPDSWDVNLTYVSGNGNLVVGRDYSVSYVVNGADGNFGGDSVLMKMDTYSYPIPSANHAGYIGFDGASLGTTTQLQISWSDANGGYIGAWLNNFEQVNNPIKGSLRISVDGSSTDWAMYKVTSAINSSGRAIVQVLYVSYSGTINPEDLVVVSFARSGDIGLGYVLQDPTQSLAVGTGTRTLNNTDLSATQSAFTVGTRIRVSAIADPNVWMEGIIGGFTGNVLLWNGDSANGSGTYTGFKVSVAGNSGAAGLLGPQGFQGFQGPIGATTLGGLNDVSIVGATTGEILNYTYFGPGVNDGLWANSTISATLGYTPADPSTIIWNRYVTNHTKYFLPPQTGTVHDSFGLPLPLSSAVGTGSSFSNAGNALPYALQYQCALATSSVAAQYGTALPIVLGSLTLEWTFERKFQLKVNMLSQQFFCGLSGRYSASIPTNQVPMADTMINSIGICKIASNNNLQFIYNDGTGIATLVDCGVNFPAFFATYAYTLTINKFRNATPIYMTLTRHTTTTGEILEITQVINTGDYSTGTTHYPAAWISNYTSASSTWFWDMGCMLQKSAPY